jgi:amino acid transporter
MGSKQTINKPQSNRVRLVVASSVMLTFISFWRAAAIVLNDLGSSAFYAGGIAEEAVGKSAPWFILGVMLFSFAVRAVYVESCSMFTRGGVYRIVKEALGGTFAKLSVSALMFDYILTGPISGVSAGQYIVGLLNELLRLCAAHHWGSGLVLHSNRGPDHYLLLVAEHQGHRGVERQGAEGDEDHDRDGCDSAFMGSVFGNSCRSASSSVADA